MRINHHLIATVLCILLISLASGIADQQPSATMTFREALSLTLQKNPLLQQAAAQTAEGAGSFWSGWGLENPEIRYMKEGIPRDGGSVFDEQRWSIHQSLDFPLRSFFRLKKLRNEYASREAMQASARRETIASLKKAYTQVAYARKIMRLRTMEYQIFKELAEIARTRVELGEASELELLKINIQKAEAENDLADAELILEQARYSLFRIIGIDPDEQSYEIVFPDTLVFFPVDISQDAALIQLTSQPEYQGAMKMNQAARWQSRESWSRMLPDLNFSLYRQDFGSGYNFYGFEVGLSLPLWFPLQQRGYVQQANARKHYYQSEQQRIYLELKERIENAWHGYENTREIIDRFEGTIRQQSESLLSQTREAYRLGEIDILNLLDTQRTYLNSEQRYYNALRSYYLQLIDLERFMGRELVFTSE